MSIKKDASGRRSIQVEVEVPGSPEEVWQAIASGPGISAWFVPTQLEEREGGTMTLNFGPGMDSVATVTSWDAPHRFTAESAGLGPNAPPMATEWTVEAREGGKCVVRVVHSLFASTDDWDDQLTGMESGWPAFFRILRLYLEHFRGQGGHQCQVPALAQASVSEAWDALNGMLAIENPSLGASCVAKGGPAPISGKVESFGSGQHPHLLIRMEQPAPGAVLLTACAAGDMSYLTMSFYFYGTTAAQTLAANEPVWREWMAKHFPTPGEAHTTA